MDVCEERRLKEWKPSTCQLPDWVANLLLAYMRGPGAPKHTGCVCHSHVRPIGWYYSTMSTYNKSENRSSQVLNKSNPARRRAHGPWQRHQHGLFGWRSQDLTVPCGAGAGARWEPGGRDAPVLHKPYPRPHCRPDRTDGAHVSRLATTRLPSSKTPRPPGQMSRTCCQPSWPGRLAAPRATRTLTRTAAAGGPSACVTRPPGARCRARSTTHRARTGTLSCCGAACAWPAGRRAGPRLSIGSIVR
jgi:hypothetical protein